MAKRRKALTAEHPTRDLEKAFTRAATAYDSMTDATKSQRRAEVLEELRRCRALVDKVYPAPKKKSTRRKKSTIQAELRLGGWTKVTKNSLEYRVAKGAGLRVVRHTYSAGVSPVFEQYYVPPWVRRMMRDHYLQHRCTSTESQLVTLALRLKADPAARAAMEVREALR